MSLLPSVLALTVLSALYLGYRVVAPLWSLRHIPGPFWAKFTNLPRVWWVKTGQAQRIHQELHEKYGDVVRFGPNMVSISDPAVLPIVYPNRMGFPKSDFYKTQRPYTPGVGAMPAVFNTQDEALHKSLRSPIAPLYNMSNVMKLEPLVDQTLAALFQQLDRRFALSQQTFDLTQWLQFFAFEVMGNISFSQRYGFLEHGSDVNGLLGGIWAFMKSAAVMGQIPWFDDIWYKNAFMAKIRGSTGFPILRVVNEHINARLEKQRQQESNEKGGLAEDDMISQFLKIQAADSTIPQWAPRAWTFSNVIAGSDSTANTMNTVMYNLLTHPETLDLLREELRTVEQDSSPFPSWKEVRDLPYLDACVMEALRLHPPFSLPFERVVPSPGLEICSRYLPPGTIVGMSPYVVNRHRPTFGEDADQWRPARWLDGSSSERTMRKNSLLTFGSGRRTCLGKNIAIMEIKKLVASIVLKYEIRVLDPQRYKTENAWFFKQWGLDVVIKKRCDTTDRTKTAPKLDIPASSSCVDVRVIDPKTVLRTDHSLFWPRPVNGFKGLDLPIYSFLISNGSRHVVFDLGMRHDWENLPPATASLLRDSSAIHTKTSVTEILDTDQSGLNIRSKDIEAIIWSHHHYDHTGDPATFPPSTMLVVGPGTLELCGPGYPANPNTTVLESDLAGREIREISFQESALRVGSFDAVDYFGDGSFYLLDAPGHSVGHMCALARVTPDSFVFMGADACHHPGAIRPSEYLPLPSSISPEVLQRLRAIGRSDDDNNETKSVDTTQPLFPLLPGLFPSYREALETRDKIIKLEASNAVLVVLTHDATLQGHMDFYPETVNDWRKKGVHLATRWLFLDEMEDAFEGDSRVRR